jgi:hypothetical protein
MSMGDAQFRNRFCKLLRLIYITFYPDQVSNCEKNMMETLPVAVPLPRTNLGGSVTFCGQRQGFGLYIVANLALSHNTYWVL